MLLFAIHRIVKSFGLELEVEMKSRWDAEGEEADMSQMRLM